jgi:hypothetical protein
MTVLSEEARREQIAAAERAWEPGHRNTTVPWRGKQEVVPVIRVSVDAVVLNPRSHRIKAQVQSHPDRELIGRDPYCTAAQDAIADLLRATDDFDALKVNLREEGQLQPGVVTHGGLLVNANCRTVALRELGEQYVDVALLPNDAGEQDIDLLELDLQVARDYKRDYSYTNQLISVLDMSQKYGMSNELIARKLQYAPSSDPRDLKSGVAIVEQMLRIYRYVSDLRARSGDKLPLTFFDTQRESLQQLDTSYEAARKADPANAQRIRETYELGLAVQVGYEPLRQVDSSFFDEYVREHLEEGLTIGEYVEALEEKTEDESGGETPAGVDLLDEIDEPTNASPANGSAVARRLVDALLSSHGSGTVSITVGDGKAVEMPRESLVVDIRNAISDAASQKKIDKSKASSLQQPIALVRDGRRKFDAAREALVRVRNDSGFNVSKFGDELAAGRRSLEALEHEYGTKDEA